MFRTIATTLPTPLTPQFIFDRHPVELAMAIELAWSLRPVTPGVPIGDPRNRSTLTNVPNIVAAATAVMDPRLFAAVVGNRTAFLWDHLIYAYMIENTRVIEIFRLVLTEFSRSEVLATVPAPAQNFLRATADLFYRDAPTGSIAAMTGQVQPDFRALRSNAYFRLFGFETNHGRDDGQPFSFHKPEVYNKDFVTTFEHFSSEVQVARENRSNTTGPNPTDLQAIVNDAGRLRAMLMARRQDGTLSREEFFAVAMMSWFHLALESDANAIIVALEAVAPNPEQRLFKIAERVKLPAHGKAGDFFALAEPMSVVLLAIERDTFNSPAAVTPLFTPPSPLEEAMAAIITHWSATTGRNLKVRRDAAARVAAA